MIAYRKTPSPSFNPQPVAPEFKGSSGGWTRSLIDLTSYAGTEVQLAFEFVATDDSPIAADNRAGWFVDEIRLENRAWEFVPDEGFEDGYRDWSASNGLWQVGAPTAGPGSGHDSAQCAGTVLDGTYHQYTDSRLISAPMELPAVSGTDELHLRFWQWFSFGSGDYGTVQISLWDTGSSSWQPWTDLDHQAVYSSFAWTRTSNGSSSRRARSGSRSPGDCRGCARSSSRRCGPPGSMMPTFAC